MDSSLVAVTWNSNTITNVIQEITAATKTPLRYWTPFCECNSSVKRTQSFVIEPFSNKTFIIFKESISPLDNFLIRLGDSTNYRVIAEKNESRSLNILTAFLADKTE